MENQRLIDWKTEAWKNRDMVAWYAKRMEENSGANRLKNSIETELCERFVRGKELLDVGIGTGRASLPLARKGYSLTGTDSSQAMLDECGRQAGNVPVRLVPGDVKALPFEDQSFDTLLSLNVMTHFPHVEDVLREWHRVVRPGGRLVFDIYSLDHLSFSRQRPVTVEELIALGADRFNMHLSLERLAKAATDLGLAVVDVVPYGSLFCGEYRHPMFAQTLQENHWWTRQLSWLAQDDAFLEFALFLDRNVFGALPVTTAGRYMVVLDNRADANGNAAWLARQQREMADLATETITAERIARKGLMTAADWRSAFDKHLDRYRNRTIAYFLLQSCFGRMDAVDWLDLAPRNGPALMRWRNAEHTDLINQHFVRSWHAEPPFAASTHVYGVDIAAGLDYELQKKMLSKVFNAFDGMAE